MNRSVTDRKPSYHTKSGNKQYLRLYVVFTPSLSCIERQKSNNTRPDSFDSSKRYLLCIEQIFKKTIEIEIRFFLLL